ncbi:MAG: 5'-3' exonuclease, partial [Nocardioides sp.]
MPPLRPPSDHPRLLLAVDAPSLLHRNHHARVDSALRDAGGRPAWALHGMLRQILEVVDQFAPDAVVFGLDDRVASVRTETYPAYKAGRREKDPALVDQLERAGALLDALGLQTVTPAGLEADDVSASAAAWAERSGWNCVIVTSDRDSFAHISARTQVL